MNYKPRDGVALLPVCDTHILVPTRAASENCPGIMRLTVMDVIFWKRLSNGATVDDLCKLYGGMCFKQPEEVRPKVEARLERLYEKGFLIKSEDDA